MAIPSGEIFLLKNVPLSATYEHTIDFKNADEQIKYFRSFIKKSLSAYTYVRKEREYLTVELPLSALDDVNYLLFKSSEGERLYFAFVTNKAYLNANSAHVYFEIDVLQTYAFDYEWRATYIKQAHADRWTSEHKPIYSKTDEGLNYGSEYSIESAYAVRQSDKIRWFLVAMKDYEGLIASGVLDGGTILERTSAFPVSSPFAFFLIPSAYSIVPEFQADPDGDFVRIGSMYEFTALMLNSAIGNYIQSISLLPYNPFITGEIQDIYESGQTSFKVTLNKDCAWDLTSFKAVSYLLLSQAIYDPWRRVLARTEWDTGLKGSMPTAEQWDEIKKNPRTTARDKRFESKLLCAPYRYNLLTDWKSDPVILKNEYLTTDQLEINCSYALTPNAPFRYWVKDYKRDPEGRHTSLFAPIATDMPIINDQYYTYMLENKNTIQANMANAIINAGAGAISGAISGGGIGGPAGAIFGGVSGAISGALNVGAMIRSENAKQADLKAKPDTVISSNDSVFNLNDKNTEITFYRMRICCENEEIIAQIFNMTGYKINRVEIPNTRSRVRFNYIQTMGANIVASINQADLMKIKEIYDNGITIWHYSEKDFNFLDYSLENIEVNLI